MSAAENSTRIANTSIPEMFDWKSRLILVQSCLAAFDDHHCHSRSHSRTKTSGGPRTFADMVSRMESAVSAKNGSNHDCHECDGIKVRVGTAASAVPRAKPAFQVGSGSSNGPFRKNRVNHGVRRVSADEKVATKRRHKMLKDSSIVLKGRGLKPRRRSAA